MATFVLVHGPAAGGWVWRPVVARLRAAGHEAWAPTLTGMGSASTFHLASPEVGLDTHVLDVANVLGYEDLQDAVLVGHSYGGMVITGAAERRRPAWPSRQRRPPGAVRQAPVPIRMTRPTRRRRRGPTPTAGASPLQGGRWVGE